MTLLIHDAFSSLSDSVAQTFVSTNISLSANTDINAILWENLKRLLFATVMSLQGVITNLIHSGNLRKSSALLIQPDVGCMDMSVEVLEILRTLAFISARFGYSAFDEWNFVYLASIDLLTASPLQSAAFILKHVPGIYLQYIAYRDIRAQHPSAKANALYFLDTLEHLIPIIPPETINTVLPTLQAYLRPRPDPMFRAHLESAHSVFLAILARGDILHNQILPYLDTVYAVRSLLAYLT